MQETVEKLKEEKLKIKEKRKEEKEKLSKFMKEWNKKKEDLELEDLKVSVTFYFKNLQLTKLVYLLLLSGIKLHPHDFILHMGNISNFRLPVLIVLFVLILE